MSFKQALNFNVNDTSNASFTIVAGVTGKFICPHILAFSLDVADTITIKIGSVTIIGPLYMPATSGMILDVHPLRLQGAKGDGLVITKGSATTKVTAFGMYSEE